VSLSRTSDRVSQNHLTSSPRLRQFTFSSMIAVISLCLSYLFLCLPAQSGQVTLAWDPVSGNSLAGYRIHYGTGSRSYTVQLDVGNVTSYAVTGLDNGVTHYFAVTAVDTSGHESGYSNEATATLAANGDIVTTPTEPTTASPPSTTATPSTDGATASPSGSENSASGGGGGCFIATAAYGSYVDPHVMVLRAFRDTFLLTNRLGRTFVRCYYATSPPIARVIAYNYLLKVIVRTLLLLPIGFSYLCLAAGPFAAIFATALALYLVVSGIRRRRLFLQSVTSQKS
jgi:hypothetical protein